MIDTKWTPAPWRVHTLTNGTEHEILHGEYYVAATFGGCTDEKLPGSNAHLIAAAPEMADALQAYIDWCAAEEDHSVADFSGRMEMCSRAERLAKSALAKARGEKP